MAPKKRKEVEDPLNTWNMQLMAAVLRFDVVEAEKLIDKGASPAAAREATPFAPDDKLSPLAAVLLQGDLSPPAIATIRFLLEHGASLNERMPLPRHGTAPPAASSTGGVLAGVQMPETTASSAATVPGTNTAGTNAASSSSGAVPATATTGGKKADGAVDASAASSASPSSAPGDVEEGTVLHYLIAVGDHAHLLQLLLLAGVRRDGMRAKPRREDASAQGGAGVGDGHAAAEENAPGSRRGSARRARGGSGVGATATTTASTLADLGKKKEIPARTQQRQAPPSNTTGAPSDAAALPAVLTPGEKEPISVLPHTLCREVEHAYNVQRQSALEAATAAVGADAQAPGRSVSRGGLGGSGGARDRSRSRSASVRVASPLGTHRSRLPLLPSMPAPTDRQRLLVEVPGESDVHGPREVTFDFDVCTSRTGLTAAEFAVERADLLATRLLLFYGAHLAHDRLVNGTQKALARACVTGQVGLVELLLNAGAPLNMLSDDGRYTLIHYAVGQPRVLEYLVRRGLSMEAENAFGESALVSLIQHGTGRNSESAIRDTVNLDDVQKLASLTPAALRNYILMPLLPAGGGSGANSGGAGAGGAASKKTGATASGRAHAVSFGNGAGDASRRATGLAGAGVGSALRASVDATAALAFARMGGGDMDTWWSFTPHTTAVLIGNVLEAGANFHGYVPDEELGLAFVRFTEEEATRKVAERESAEALAAAATAATSKRDETGNRQGRLGKKRMSASGSSGARTPVAAAPTRSSAAPAGSDRHNHTNDDGFPMQGDMGDDHTASINASQSTSPHHTSDKMMPTAKQVPGRLPLRLTPLMHAIVNYHPELISKLVLEYKVDLSRRDSLGATALHYACAMVPQHNTSVLRLLLDVLTKESGVGNTLASARRRSVGAVQTTVVEDAPFDINAVDMAGMTALHYAAACGNEAAVALLLSTVSGPQQSQSSGVSHHAGMGGGTGTMTVLQAGRPDARGRTALHCAVEANAARVVELLVRHNSVMAEVTLAHSSGDGFLASLGIGTSGSFAGSTGSRSASRGRATSPSSASQSFSQRRASAFTANAAATAQLPFVTIDIEAEDSEEHMTALEVAIKGGVAVDAAIPNVLLREGNANFYRSSGLPSGGSLLHRAVMDGNVGCVQALLDQYADPNEVDDKDETPLFTALRQLEKCRLRHSDDDEAETVDEAALEEQTENDALSQARRRQQRRTEKQQRMRDARLAILDALLRAGALVNAQSMNTLATPLHLAAANAEHEVLKRIFFEHTPADVRSGAHSRYTADTANHHRSSRGSSVTPSKPQQSTDAVDADTQASSGRLGIADRVRAQRRGHDKTDAEAEASSGGAGRSAPHTETQLVALDAWLLTNDRDETPLHLLCARAGRAAQAAAVPILEKLLGAPTGTMVETWGAEGPAADLRERLLSQLNHQGRTALHAACRAHFVEAVALLLAARPATVFGLDARGWSPLHDAVAFRTYTPTRSTEERMNDDDEDDGEARMVAVVEALATAVSALATTRSRAGTQLPWSGLPPPPARHAMTARLFSDAASPASLTAQITSHHHQEKQWLFMRTDGHDMLANSPSSPPGPVDTAAVEREERAQYAACVDERGRSALLLAGDVGNVAAAKAVLRLFCA